MNDLWVAQTEVDIEKASSDAAWKEAELLHSKPKDMEQEWDDIRTHLESELGGHSEMMCSFGKFSDQDQSSLGNVPHMSHLHLRLQQQSMQW